LPWKNEKPFVVLGEEQPPPNKDQRRGDKGERIFFASVRQNIDLLVSYLRFRNAISKTVNQEAQEGELVISSCVLETNLRSGFRIVTLFVKAPKLFDI